MLEKVDVLPVCVCVVVVVVVEVVVVVVVVLLLLLLLLLCVVVVAGGCYGSGCRCGAEEGDDRGTMGLHSPSSARCAWKEKATLRTHACAVTGVPLPGDGKRRDGIRCDISGTFRR